MALDCRVGINDNLSDDGDETRMNAGWSYNWGSRRLLRTTPTPRTPATMNPDCKFVPMFHPAKNNGMQWAYAAETLKAMPSKHRYALVWNEPNTFMQDGLLLSFPPAPYATWGEVLAANHVDLWGKGIAATAGMAGGRWYTLEKYLDKRGLTDVKLVGPNFLNFIDFYDGDWLQNFVKGYRVATGNPQSVPRMHALGIHYYAYGFVDPIAVDKEIKEFFSKVTADAKEAGLSDKLKFWVTEFGFIQNGPTFSIEQYADGMRALIHNIAYNPRVERWCYFAARPLREAAFYSKEWRKREVFDSANNLTALGHNLLKYQPGDWISPIR